MTTYALTDSATMLRRNLRHAMRYPALSFGTAVLPIIFLLLFRYVFGGAIGAGIGGGGDYTDYLVPGIILMTVAAGTTSTAISVSTDLTEGIVARFRTMPIARVSLLTGHVLGSLLQTLASTVVVLGVAFLIGFRTTADPLEWLAVTGVLVLLTFALTWLAVALALVSKNPEGASNIVLPLVILPFLGSGFVPTDSMSTGVRWFAEYQPFTPIINTLRGLLIGTSIGSDAFVAVAWCIVMAAVGFLWGRALFNRDPSRR